MFTPRILWSQPYSISRLRVENCDHEWHGTPEYEELVQIEWARIVRRAKSHVWDGKYYRVLNLTALENEAGAQPIRFGTICYRYIASFPLLDKQHAQYALEPLNHLSTTALIRTRDGSYLFGIRKQNGFVDLIGGGAQCDQIEISSGAGIEQNIYKEIREEIGLNREDIDDLTGIGIVYSSTSNVLVVGHVCLSLTSDEIRARFEERVDDEMAQLVFISEERVREFLLEMPDYRNLLPQLIYG